MNLSSGIMATKSKTENRGKKGSRYARFFCLLKGRERFINKDELVEQFTDGRTTHLSQMTSAEFHEMCDAIEGRFNQTAYEQQLKKARSSVLLRIGRLGINTIDNWDEVNAFLMSPKIAGKLLYEMDLAELKALIKKLEAINRNGGIKSIHETEKAEQEAKVKEELNRLITMPTATTIQPKFLS